MPKLSGEPIPFTQELVLEIAMDWDDPYDIAERHEVSRGTFEDLQLYEPFVKAVAATREHLAEHGITAQFKAKVALEDLIPTMHKLTRAPDAPHQTRVAAFSALMKLAGLDKPDGPAGNQGFVVNIMLGDDDTPTLQVAAQAPAPVLEAETSELG